MTLYAKKGACPYCMRSDLPMLEAPQPQSLLSDEEIYAVSDRTLTPLSMGGVYGLLHFARAIESKVRQQDEEVRKDAERLMFSFEADGFCSVEKDKYEFAVDVMNERGHEEPTKEDELIGLRRLIDAAIAKQKGE